MKSFLVLVRREIWEHRALWMVPLVVALLMLLAAVTALGITGSWEGSDTTIKIVDLGGKRMKIQLEDVRENKVRLQELKRELQEKARELKELEQALRESRSGKPPRLERREEEIERELEKREAQIKGEKERREDAERRMEELGAELGREMGKLGVELGREMGKLGAELGREIGKIGVELGREMESLGEVIEKEAEILKRELELEFETHSEDGKDKAASPQPPLAGKGAAEAPSVSESIEIFITRHGNEIGRLESEIRRQKEDIKKQIRVIVLKGDKSQRGDSVTIDIDPLEETGQHEIFKHLGKPSLAQLVEIFAGLEDADKKGVVRGAMAFIGTLFFVIALVMVFFYVLDSLYGERKDRTALFWKSLPVSDAETVLSKVSTAVLVAPVISCVAAVLTILAMLLIGSAVIWGFDKSAWDLIWLPASPIIVSSQLLFLFIIQFLWYTPVFGWIFLVSAWARRMPFLYVLLVPGLLSLFEVWVFGSHYIANAIGTRLAGITGTEVGMVETVVGQADISITTGKAIDFNNVLDFQSMLLHPGLWFGLVLAAMFIAAAIWMRRYRDEY